jgi:predicted ferric reductase
VKTHSLLAIAILVLLWLHINVLDTYLLVCFATAASTYLLQKVSWLLQFTYRNVGPGPSCQATILRNSHPGLGGEIIQIQVDTKRPWSVVPGQFVYLSLPRLRSLGFGFLESHPFMIAWVVENDKGHATTIMVLAQCYKGFTRRLQIANINASALVDGPYGGLEADCFTHYDKVLLMSNGIGIAAHLYTARYLLFAHNRQTARVRRLTLIWLLETQGMFTYSTHCIMLG